MGVRPNRQQAIFLASLMSLVLVACGRPDATNGANGSAGGGNASSGGASVGTTAAGAASNAGVAIEDSVITTKLKTAILADTTLKGSDISVETRNGEVLLTGSVTSDAQKDHTAKIARALSGVKNVNNKLTIKK